MEIVSLRTEDKINPLGIAALSPRFSWNITTQGRGVRQLAYEIRCAADKKDLPNGNNLLWNPGRIETEQSIYIEYKGLPLLSGQTVYWQVKVWDNQGNESAWSHIASFETGLLNSHDWKARWIIPDSIEDPSDSAPCPYLRKDFSVRAGIRKARVYVTSRGLYELSVNGTKAGDQLFTPGWTSYHHRLQYQVFDITDQLSKGENCLGIILADGWFRGYMGWYGMKKTYGNKLALLLQLYICYSDGSEAIITSDESWRSHTGPILKSDLYRGETYDARLEITNWNFPGFDDSGWNTVHTENYGVDNLVSSEGIPVRVTETLRPIKRIITPGGEMVFDLGQNIVGRVQIKLPAGAGTKITLQHAEELDQEGNFYTANLRSAKAEDTYFFKGTGVEVYEPHFTFHGFRYIKICDYPDEIPIDAVCGKVIHSDMAPAGEFECSEPLINQLQKNIQWGLRGNFLDIPTDCPQRDERMGWTGDAQVFASTACFNRNVSAFYRKWMKDLIADQRQDGSVPWVVPNVLENGAGTGWSDGFGSTGWADAAVIIPWTVYRQYGDKRILDDQYDSMKAWVEYMIRESGEDGIFRSDFHFGDWLSFAEYYSLNYNAPDYGYAGANTDKELIATAYFYYTTSLMQKIAVILDKPEDAARYARLLPEIKKVFQHEFLTQAGRLTSHTQTAYTLALSFELLPEDKIGIAAKRLADDVTYFGHLTTGFLGTPLICQALTENGYPDIAYNLLFNTKYPSWLYPITKGATTIWERWDGIKPDGSFQDAGMNSFNHYAYGAIGNWLYTSVAGINADENDPGYKKIIIKPRLTHRLKSAKASHISPYGPIVSHWRRDDKEVSLDLDIPVNTTAIVCLPVADRSGIYESDQAIDQQEELSILDSIDNWTRIEIGSGKYCFKFMM